LVVGFMAPQSANDGLVSVQGSPPSWSSNLAGSPRAGMSK